MLYAGSRNWGRKRVDPLPQESTGGPPPDVETEELAEQRRRLGFVERRLDWITRRVERLEETIAADAIAPMDPPPGGGGR